MLTPLRGGASHHAYDLMASDLSTPSLDQKVAAEFKIHRMRQCSEERKDNNATIKEQPSHEALVQPSIATHTT